MEEAVGTAEVSGEEVLDEGAGVVDESVSREAEVFNGGVEGGAEVFGGKAEEVAGVVVSPDGTVRCEVKLKKGVAYYAVWMDERMVVGWSRLGLMTQEGVWGRNLELVTKFEREKNELWETQWGEERLVRNHYRELELNFWEGRRRQVLGGEEVMGVPGRGVGEEKLVGISGREGAAEATSGSGNGAELLPSEESYEGGHNLTLRIRVFDEGVAFRYELSEVGEGAELVILDELTEFKVAEEAKTWWTPAYQPDRYEYNYVESRVTEVGDLGKVESGPAGLDWSLGGAVQTPLTIETVGMKVAEVADASGAEMPEAVDDATSSLGVGAEGAETRKKSADAEKIYLSIHEAALYDYGSMTLRWVDGALKADITPLSNGTRAIVNLPWQTPWRVIMLSRNLLDLTLNRMILNLNEPPKEDLSWVKPLKFMGIWWALYVGEWTWAPGERHGATTEHMRDYIDACRRLGLGGVLAEGWNNGWEGDWLENGRRNDFLTAQADYDLPALAQYAREQGVELVMHHETVGFVDNYERQLEEAYALCAQNGIHYIKSGYANSRMEIGGRKEFHHSQVGVRHYQRTVELAAKHQICLDIHEPIKGTGIERTWPNLLTREGARGQEYESGALHPSHGTFLPFTRMLAGGMDYTSGILDVNNGVRHMETTIVRQLAYFVTIFSGMQMAADRPWVYEDLYPDLYEFIRAVPASWERTVPLAGEVGRYYAVARQARRPQPVAETGVEDLEAGLSDWRRGGAEWFIGGVTNEEARTLKLKLDFLDEGEYVAEIYRDGEGADFRLGTRENYVIERRTVRREEELEVWLGVGGGVAVRIYR